MTKPPGSCVLTIYCRRRLSQEALEILAKIQSSPPVRRSHTGADNAPLWYPSVKIGSIIQAGSENVEFAGILELEYDIPAPE